MIIERKEITALVKTNDLEAFQNLFAEGWDPNYTNEYLSPGRPKDLPINYVIETKNMPLLKLFIENKAELNYKGEPTTREAAQSSTPEILRFLVINGADINAVSTGWETSTIEAATMQRKEEDGLEILKTIVELGMDVNRFGGNGLIKAAWNGQLSIIKYLLEIGVDINFKDKKYLRTPLHNAVFSSKYDAVQLLLSNGAEVTHVDSIGKRPYHLAKQNKDQTLMDLLFQYEPSDLHQADQCLNKLKKQDYLQTLLSTLEQKIKRLNFLSH